MFIVLEGIDGTGKTAVAKILSEVYSFTYFELTQPSIRKGMDLILNQCDSKQLDPNVYHMMNMASLKHTSNLISEEIALGNNIVCDRYYPTILGYHRVMAPIKGSSDLFEPDINSYDIVQPDVMLQLTIDEKIRQQRMNIRERTTSSDRLMDDSTIRNAILKEYSTFNMLKLDTSLMNEKSTAKTITDYLFL